MGTGKDRASDVLAGGALCQPVRKGLADVPRREKLRTQGGFADTTGDVYKDLDIGFTGGAFEFLDDNAMMQGGWVSTLAAPLLEGRASGSTTESELRCLLRGQVQMENDRWWRGRPPGWLWTGVPHR